MAWSILGNPFMGRGNSACYFEAKIAFFLVFASCISRVVAEFTKLIMASRMPDISTIETQAAFAQPSFNSEVSNISHPDWNTLSHASLSVAIHSLRDARVFSKMERIRVLMT